MEVGQAFGADGGDPVFEGLAGAGGEIAYLLGLNPATVHRVLTSYKLARLTHLDRATGRTIRRYEPTAPGDLVHVDIK